MIDQPASQNITFELAKILIPLVVGFLCKELWTWFITRRKELVAYENLSDERLLKWRNQALDLSDKAIEANKKAAHYQQESQEYFQKLNNCLERVEECDCAEKETSDNLKLEIESKKV